MLHAADIPQPVLMQNKCAGSFLAARHRHNQAMQILL